MTRSDRGATRRVVLLGGAASVFASACSDDPAGPPAPRRAPSPAPAAILGLSFRTVHRHRPFALVAPGFEALETRPGTPPEGLQRADAAPPAPFAAVELQVTAAGSGGAGGSAGAAAGLATAEDEHVLVRWSAETSTVSLEVRRAGRTSVVSRRRVDLAGTFGLAFALCENQVTALVDTGEGWTPVLTERSGVADLVDLRREDVLPDYRYAWEGAGVTVTSVRAGVFGMAGLRDPHLVQEADGTPYQREGRLFLTWTCAGLGFFQQAHWSVWSLDPAAPEDMRLEAQIFTRRDGLLLGDHAGQIVRDGDRWVLANSSWGDFEPGSIHVRHAVTTDDVLSGVHVLDTEPAPLPTEHGAWDPSLTRVDGTWHVAFVESPSQDPFDFHPALATTEADEWSEGLSLVAAATDLFQCEGPIIATVEGDTWLLASDGDARVYPVFDLAGRPVGRLDAPYPTNIPHPQLVPDPAGGWLMITFEGTQYAEDVLGYGGHGDVVVMRSR